MLIIAFETKFCAHMTQMDVMINQSNAWYIFCHIKHRFDRLGCYANYSITSIMAVTHECDTPVIVPQGTNLNLITCNS